MMTWLIVGVVVVLLIGAWTLGFSPLRLWRAGFARIRAWGAAALAWYKARRAS